MQKEHTNMLVSIVIPSFNHRKYIGDAIDSVLKQTHSNLECIVIDDGSTDGSPEYLRERYRDENRVIIKARENRGAHNTINEAMTLSKGDFVSILNSDDVYHTERIEKLIKASQGLAQPSLLITGLSVVDENGNPADSSGPAAYYNLTKSKLAGSPDAAGFWVGNIAMTTSNFFFSKKVLEHVGLFRNLRYTHDWDWALRASEQFPVKRLDENLLHYRVHGKNTISETNIWKHISENAAVFAAALLRTNTQLRGAASQLSTTAVMANMLKNESFLPLPTLHLLTCGKSEAELIDGVADQSVEKQLQDLHQASGLPLDVFLSSSHISKKLLATTSEQQSKSDSANTPNDRGNWLIRTFRRVIRGNR